MQEWSKDDHAILAFCFANRIWRFGDRQLKPRIIFNKQKYARESITLVEVKNKKNDVFLVSLPALCLAIYPSAQAAASFTPGSNSSKQITNASSAPQSTTAYSKEKIFTSDFLSLFLTNTGRLALRLKQSVKKMSFISSIVNICCQQLFLKVKK